MIPIRGNRIVSAAEAQVIAMPCGKAEVPPIEIDRFYRNGQHPQAVSLNKVNEAANQAVLFRTKELFRGAGLFFSLGGASGLTSFGAGDRTRWRGAFRTGPYAHAIMAVMQMRVQNIAGASSSAYVRMDLYSDTAEAVLVNSTNFYYGPNDGGNIDGWPYLTTATQFVDGISADTDYYVKFTDVDYGRLQSVTLIELASMTEGLNGYLAQNMTTHTPVLNLHRQNLITVSNALLQKGHAKVFDWMIDDGTAPITNAGAAVNIVDVVSGAVSAQTPGPTFDMTGKDRVSQTAGVPCVFKAFGRRSAGVGSVLVKDSGGATLATINTFGATNSWQSTTFNLPASVAKYDVHFAGAGGTMILYAATIYPNG